MEDIEECVLNLQKDCLLIKAQRKKPVLIIVFQSDVS